MPRSTPRPTAASTDCAAPSGSAREPSPTTLNDDERRVLRAAQAGEPMPDVAGAVGIFVLLRARGLLATGRWDVTPEGAAALEVDRG